MGNIVAQEIAKSQASQNLETIRARQAHFIKWNWSKHIDDPVGPEPDRKILFAVYVKSVMLGDNYCNRESLRSATCKGYATDAAQLFILRNCPSPFVFSDESNWTTILIKNLETEEGIAIQRRPLNAKIFAAIYEMAKSASLDSAEAVSCNVVAVGKQNGWRRGEHSQTKKKEVDYHVYPSGTKVMKSINGNDVQFTSLDDKLFLVKSNSNMSRLKSVKMKFRHQKNRQNNQEVRFHVDKKNPESCSVVNLAQMVQRKRRLGHSMHLPLTVYLDDTGSVAYLTGDKLTQVIRRAVRKVYPDMPEKEVQLHSCHSIRVWACVELFEAGMQPEFIKKRLRWLGESYRVYLRDTSNISKQHMQALQKSATEFMELIDQDICDQMAGLSVEDLDEENEYDGGD